jgi:hypothetical protein
LGTTNQEEYEEVEREAVESKDKVVRNVKM